METAKLLVSKLDAAKRQLETGISLYFHNADPVSIHTLVAASYNLLRDLNKNNGGKPLFAKELVFDYIKEGYQKEFRTKINAPENFFKHADRDFSESLEFNPKLSETFVLEACSVYFRLTGEDPVLFRVFRAWYIVNNPKLFKFPKEQLLGIYNVKDDLLSLGRVGFFNETLPILSRPF